MEKNGISTIAPSENDGERMLVTVTITLTKGELEKIVHAVKAALQNESGYVVEKDKLLTPQEAAEMLGQTVRWVYRHAPEWKFTRRLSRRCLRFPENPLRRYAMARRS